MAHALEGPVFIVSRCISSSSRMATGKNISSGNSTRLPNATRPSKVLAALENLDCSVPSDEIESDIETLGPLTSNNTLDRNCCTRRQKNQSIDRKLDTTASPELKLGSAHPSVAQSKPLASCPKGKQVGRTAKQATPGFGIDEVIHQTKAGKVAIEETVNTEHAQIPSLSSSSLVEGELPLYSYKDYSKPKPVLVYTTHEGEANDLVDGLKSGPLAFDIEWRVFFTRKSALSRASTTERRVAVVQLADTSGLILIIQIYGMSRFPIKLQALIENPKIPKMGANILNDGVKLFRDYGIFAKGLVELGALSLFVHPGSTEKKRKIVSLAKLTARYCKKVLDKGKVRTGNWEAELGSVQLEYAGNDVHCTMMIYQRLVEIAKERGIDFNIFDSEFSSEVLINHNQSELIPLSGQASEGSSVSIARTGSSTSQGSSFNEGTGKTSPQYLRAYRYWHDQSMSIEKMCLVLSTKGRLAEGIVGEPLKPGTVISYVIGALQHGPQLPFDMMKLRDLVQSDAQSWVRHRDWILKAWAEGRGV